MTEYVPPAFTYPSKTFGPVFIELETDTIESLYEKVSKEIDSQLVETFEGDLEILIKNKPIKNVYWVRKAHTVQDLRVDKKKHLEPQILASIDVVDS